MVRWLVWGSAVGSCLCVSSSGLGGTLVSTRFVVPNATEDETTNNSPLSTVFTDRYPFSPGARYTYRVRAASARGVGPASAASPILQVAKRPGTPVAPTVLSTTATSVTLSTAAPYLSGLALQIMTVHVYEAGKFGKLPSKKKSFPAETFTVSGLRSGLEYEVKVQAWSEVGVSDLSLGTKFTLCPPALPPLDLSVLARTDSSITIGWGEPPAFADPHAGSSQRIPLSPSQVRTSLQTPHPANVGSTTCPVLGYTVKVDDKVFADELDSRNFTFTGLESWQPAVAGTAYAFSVRTRTLNGESDFGPPISIIAGSAVPKMDKPLVQRADEAGIKIAWHPPTYTCQTSVSFQCPLAAVQYYRVYVRRTDPDAPTSPVSEQSGPRTGGFF